MRCFIGIRPSDEYLSLYSEHFYSNKLFKLSRFFRLTPPENVHITLKFLGVVDEKSREFELFIKELSGLKPKEQTLRTKKILEFFPEDASPRVIYHGIYEEHSGTLRDLVGSIDRAAEKVSSEKSEKGFTPHLTIGRMKKDLRVSRKDLLGLDTKAFECSFEMKEFSLFKSELKESGAVYTELAKF